MASVYQGKYTFPVASTAERSIQQGATAQAQMYAGLGQTLGKTFGDAIGKYFDVQDEKKAAESMAENQIALDVVYGGRDVPADQKERIKDMRGVMKASGGFKNFLGRIETERANQRADRAEALNKITQERMLAVHKQSVALGGLQIGALEDAATTRKATQEFRRFPTGEPGPVTPRGEELQRGLTRLGPRKVPGTEEFKEFGEADLAPLTSFQSEIASAMTSELEGERKPVADMTSIELSRYLSKSDLSAEAKIAGLERVESLEAKEMAALKFNVELGALGLAGHKSREELTQLFRKPVNALRADFTKEKPVMLLDEVRVGYQKVLGHANPAKPTAAGDLGLIFGFMKVLDPGSIVRESGFESVANAGGLDSRVMNFFQQWKDGQKLQTDQRAELVRQAKIAAEAQLKTVAGKVEFYKNLANTRGIKIEQIIPQDTLTLIEKGFTGTVETAGTPGSDGSTKVGNFNVKRGGDPPRTPTIEELIEQAPAENQ